MACSDRYKCLHGLALLVGVVSALLLGSVTVLADLQLPSWYDANSIGQAPDWRFRVPISIPGTARPNHTIKLDVDFAQLLTNAGATGTFDANSPRVVRSTGAICTIQQFTDDVYGGSTDNVAGRGEIRFIMEDIGPETYYLYFDIQENGIKPAWPASQTINGNFEFGAVNSEDPPGWEGTATEISPGAFIGQAQTISNRRMRIRPGYGDPRSVRTNEYGRTGDQCFLLGVRDFEETNTGAASVTSTLSRTIDLPSANRGQLKLYYRVKGWDSSFVNASLYDWLRIRILDNNGDPVLVGPTAINPYSTHPYSPNYTLNQGGNGTPGYSLYNGFETGWPSSVESWYEVTYDLPAVSQVTLQIETHNYYQYRSWFHIDDVAWSVLDENQGVALGALEIFGVNVTDPADTGSGAPAHIYFAGEDLVILAQVDAEPTSMTADVYAPGSVLVAGGIPLYNDGSNGDAVSGDEFWTNAAAYTFDILDPHGNDWQVVVTAAYAGLTATDTQVFTLAEPSNISVSKTTTTFSDPYNGETDPKNIPGALLTYTITVENFGGAAVDLNSVVITDALPGLTDLYVGNPLLVNGPVTFTDGSVGSGLGFDPATDLSFSTNGSSWTTGLGGLPPDPPLGIDPSIRYIRINPKGYFNGASGGDPAAFTLTFKVRLQ